jgi:hypothetical protein
MADAVLVPNPSDPAGPSLLAYPVTVTNSNGVPVTGLAFANIIVGKAADDQNAEIIALLQALVAAAGGSSGGGGTPAAGSADFSVAGNPIAGAVQ